MVDGVVMMRGYFRILGVVCLFSLCLGVQPALAQAPEDAPAIIGQIVYQKSGLQESEKRNVQGYFNYKLRSVAGTHRVLNAGYFQKNVAYSRCDNGLCMAAMGRDLGVDQMIQTRVTRRGKNCVVQCTIFNVNKKKNERTIVEQGNCSQENLFILVENAVIRLARFNRAAFSTEERRVGTTEPLADETDEAEAMPLGENHTATPDPVDSALKKAPVKVSKPNQALVRRASKLYVATKYRDAMKQARKALKGNPTNSMALQILGASACYLKNTSDAQWAMARLPLKKQTLLRMVCQRNGVKLAPVSQKRKTTKKR